jgi:putative DNA methylase
MIYRFEVRTTGKGNPPDGTVNRKGGVCLLTGTPMPFDHIREQGKTGQMGARLMAIVAKGLKGRVYLSPLSEHEAIAEQAKPDNVPDTDLPEQALGFRVQLYGMLKHRHLFTDRQLVALTIFSDLVMEARTRVEQDSRAVGLMDNVAVAYADAVATYLTFAVDRTASMNSRLCWWNTGGFIAQTFARPTLSMIWDFAECNLFGNFTGNWDGAIDWITRAMIELPAYSTGNVRQQSATLPVKGARELLISTDPPYYDNIGYADLSDFFYVWLKRSLGSIYPDLLSTILVPKVEELIATPFRFEGNKAKAQRFFEEGLGTAFEEMREVVHLGYPLTVYYAFKQAETTDELDTASTGWVTMLEGLIKAGFSITGTWPMRTERTARPREHDSNALASSIVLVCRPRPGDAPLTTRREFLKALRQELPTALKQLQKGNIAPVDLAQASIGPGMAIYSRHSRVLESDGSSMRVRTALALINQALDEYLAEQEGEFDADTRWALAWYEQFAFKEGPFGDAETLSKAKNTSVQGMVEAHILRSGGGKVHLLRRKDLPDDWDPVTEKRLTVWEIAQHLIRTLDTKGESGAANLLVRVPAGPAEAARDLAYRLYTLCERKGWAQEALPYNSLVVAWPEVARLAREIRQSRPVQERLL